ncbi:uncharacterized protein [Argopecten irradians]|uniref:uncharacterized protein n=1 Tax=Argopecten irradians TaxID=31199 RepID=UPI0037241834
MPRKKKYSRIDGNRPKHYDRRRREKSLQRQLNASTEKRILEDHMYEDSSTETETPDFNPLDNAGVDYVYPVRLEFANGYLINHDHSYVESTYDMSDQIKMEIIPEEFDESVSTSNDGSLPTANYNHNEIKNESLSLFDIIAEEIKRKIMKPYVCISVEDDIEIVEFYKKDRKISVKLSVTIDRTFQARVLVHRKELPSSHNLWRDLPAQFDSCDKILSLLAMLQEYAVCIGNPDEEFQILLPIGSGFEGSSVGEVYAYREGDFNAQLRDLSYKSTIRSVNCVLLAEGRRCPNCSSYRRSLRDRKNRLEEKAKHMQKNLVNSKYKHKDMTKDMLIEKIKQQKACLNTLQQDVDRQRRTIKHQREKLGKMGVLQHDDDHIQFTQQIEHSPTAEQEH